MAQSNRPCYCLSYVNKQRLLASLLTANREKQVHKICNWFDIPMNRGVCHTEYTRIGFRSLIRHLKLSVKSAIINVCFSCIIRQSCSWQLGMKVIFLTTRVHYDSLWLMSTLWFSPLGGRDGFGSAPRISTFPCKKACSSKSSISGRPCSISFFLGLGRV